MSIAKPPPAYVFRSSFLNRSKKMADAKRRLGNNTQPIGAYPDPVYPPVLLSQELTESNPKSDPKKKPLPAKRGGTNREDFVPQQDSAIQEEPKLKDFSYRTEEQLSGVECDSWAQYCHRAAMKKNPQKYPKIELAQWLFMQAMKDYLQHLPPLEKEIRKLKATLERTEHLSPR